MASFCGLLFLAFSTFLLFNFYYQLFDGTYFKRVRECTSHNIVVCIITPGNSLNVTNIGTWNVNGSSLVNITSTETTPIIEDNITLKPEDEKLPDDLNQLEIEPNGNLTLLQKLIEKILPKFGRGQATQTTLEQQSTLDQQSTFDVNSNQDTTD